MWLNLENCVELKRPIIKVHALNDSVFMKTSKTGKFIDVAACSGVKSWQVTDTGYGASFGGTKMFYIVLIH